MKKIKILLTRRLLDVDKQYIEKELRALIGDAFQIIDLGQYDEETLCKSMKDVNVLLGPFVTKKMIEMSNDLKLIQIPWTGVDSFNFDEVKNACVTICNSHSNADAVAEMTLGLTLDLIKKISFHDRKLREGNWNRGQEILNLKSKMLSEMTVCILGYGNIGGKIAKLLKAFGTKVIGVTYGKRKDSVADEMYQQENWLEAVSKSDLCICALPLTERTKNLINEKSIKSFKNKSVIINIARAGIVDENAIYRALMTGEISGYASDVWWNTPKRGESKTYVSVENSFEKMDNVILSPHRAAFIDGKLPHLDDAIKNISRLFRNEPLENVVDVTKKY